MSEQTPESLLSEVVMAATVANAADYIVTEEVLPQVTALWRLWSFGDLSDAAFKMQVVDVIVIGCDRAWFEAGSIATDVVDHDEPIVPDFPEEKYRDHLTKAVDTAFEEIDAPTSTIVWESDDATVDTGDTTVEGIDEQQPLPTTVERLATAEPTSALQEGMLESYRQIGATGYVRGLDADPCERCEKWWYRGGHVWPIDKFWNWHPYCQCYPIPVFGTNEGDEKK